MQADLGLKTKQSIWEHPRNIALMVTAVAAIAGFVGFKIGQKEPVAQAPVVNVYPQIYLPATPPAPATK
jgi:hypothetical protein